MEFTDSLMRCIGWMLWFWQVWINDLYMEVIYSHP